MEFALIIGIGLLIAYLCYKLNTDKIIYGAVIECGDRPDSGYDYSELAKYDVKYSYICDGKCYTDTVFSIRKYKTNDVIKLLKTKKGKIINYRWYKDLRNIGFLMISLYALCKFLIWVFDILTAQI